VQSDFEYHDGMRTPENHELIKSIAEMLTSDFTAN